MVRIKSYKRTTPMSIYQLEKGEVMVYGVKEPTQPGFVDNCASYFGSYHAIPDNMREGHGFVIPIKNSRGLYLTANQIELNLVQFYYYAKSHKDMTFYLTQTGFKHLSPHSAHNFKAVLKKLSKLENVWMPLPAWKVI